MHAKNIALTIIFVAIALILIAVGIYAMELTTDKTKKEHHEREIKAREILNFLDRGNSHNEEKAKIPNRNKENRPSYGDPAKCSDLRPSGVQLNQLVGRWVLQEKLEFPDGAQNTYPNSDQTAICQRMEVNLVDNNNAAVQTYFYLKRQNTKNFTGHIKIKDNNWWNFQLLGKEHDGIMLEANPIKYLIFVDCVSSKNDQNDVNTPANAFILTRGTLPDRDMEKIRHRIESLLKHNDEYFLDYGGYCYDDATINYNNNNNDINEHSNSDTHQHLNNGSPKH